MIVNGGKPKMPKNVKAAFFRLYKGYGNDLYVEHCINTNRDPSDDEKLLDDWLIVNGADPGGDDSEGETVIIKHWW